MPTGNGLKNFNQTSTLSDTDALKNVKAPIRILWGDTDTIAPIKNWEKLREVIPNTSLYIISDVGHMPHLENFTLFNDTLTSALQEK